MTTTPSTEDEQYQEHGNPANSPEGSPTMMAKPTVQPVLTHRASEPRPRATAATRRARRIVAVMMSRQAQLIALATVVILTVAMYAIDPAMRHGVGHAFTVLRSGDQHEIGAYLRSWGVWGPVISLAIMVAQAIIAPIPGALVVFANGIAFGTFWGTVISVAGQTLAAIVCFWIARLLGRGPVEKIVGRFGLESLDRWVGRWGVVGIIALRMVPGMAFDGVSYGAGLLNMRLRTFALATMIGITPQSLFYIWMIEHYPKLTWIFTAVAFGILTVVAVAGIIAGLVQRRRAPRTLPAASTTVSRSHPMSDC